MSFKKTLSAALTIIFVTVTMFQSQAQLDRGNDTSYYVFFPESLTARIYSSKKYTSFFIKDKDGEQLTFRPNTRYTLGAGATYHNLSGNVAFGFGFLNKGNEDKGDTKSLDLQTHIYKPKWAIDLFGQFYKGYYLTADDVATPVDTKINLFGLSTYRIFNYKRFSYRAAFIQNEWQKKSAGTFLVGAEAYYGIIKSDSALIPHSILDPSGNPAVNKVNYFSIGPGVGYAYTLVAFQHIFATGSLTSFLSFGSATSHYTISGDKNSNFGINPGLRYRMAVGYNGRIWNVSANWVADNHFFSSKSIDNKYQLRTGNYRFIIARRFNTGPKLRKALKPVGEVIKE